MTRGRTPPSRQPMTWVLAGAILLAVACFILSAMELPHL